ncbi:hypothetical protein OQA88_7492 [Cercophora sp. LCS_1]
MSQSLPLRLNETTQCDTCKSQKTTLGHISTSVGLGCSCCKVLQVAILTSVPENLPKEEVIDDAEDWEVQSGNVARIYKSTSSSEKSWFPKEYRHLYKIFGSDVTSDFNWDPSTAKLYWMFVASYVNIFVDTKAFPSELEALKGPVMGLILQEAPITTGFDPGGKSGVVYERMGVFNVYLQKPQVVEDYEMCLEMGDILKGSEHRKTAPII